MWAQVDDSGEWVRGRLAALVGPGAVRISGPVAMHERDCTILTPDQLPDQLRELRRPIADGVPKNGRYGIAYERRWNGRDAVWLEAAEYAFGMFGDRSVYVQPVRRAGSGALLADGEPVELTEGHHFTGHIAGPPTGVIVAVLVGVLLLGVVSAVSLTDLASSSGSADGFRVPERTAGGPTAPLRPAAATPAASPAPAPNQAVATDPAAARAPGAGDLGLQVPISRPACDGGYGVIVANATRPGSYRQEINGFLARFSGASYLLAERACSSLRGHTESGDSIYAVYYGPYTALGNACAMRSRIGGGSYIRRLDNGPESSLIIKC